METSIIEKAKAKISAEISSYENLKREYNIGTIVATEERKGLEEFLYHAVESEEGLAELVIKDEKSIAKGLAWCGKQIPQELKKHGMAVIDNATVYEWFIDYLRVDEEKEQAEAEAKRKAEAAKRVLTSSQAKEAAEEAKRRMAEAEAAAKAKAEAEKRKKMGVCDGQLDFFSLLDPQPKSEPTPIREVSTKVEVPVSEEEQANVFDLLEISHTESEDGLTQADCAAEMELIEEGGDSYVF